MWEPGAIVADKYRIERKLGEGGMGVVVEATHIHLGSRVALKVLRPEMLQNAQAVERFLREARATAQLQSENLCRVSDVGTLPNGTPFMVMELLRGEDLARVRRREGVLPPEQVVEYVMQACQAIAEAHALGIVHRDLKPSNLFLMIKPTGKPLVKVLDFGVAKAQTSEQDFSLTQSTSVMGSPGYMSPEQIKSSKVVDARSDIWSLGVVMFELLTGTQPFKGETITELAVRVATDPTPMLPPHIPGHLAMIVARCLEKDPARRFQDVAQLATALSVFTPNGRDMATTVTRMLFGATADLPAMPIPASATNPTTLGSASGAVEGNRRRRGGLLAGVIGGGIAVGVIVAVLVTKHGNSPQARAAHPAPEPATAPASTETPAAPPSTETTAAPTPTPTPTPSAPTPSPPPAETANAAPPVDTGSAAPVVTAKPEVVVKKPAKKPTKPADSKKKPTVEDLSEDRK